MARPGDVKPKANAPLPAPPINLPIGDNPSLHPRINKAAEGKSTRAGGRASIPTPAVRFPLDDGKPGQLLHNTKGAKPKRSRGFSGWLVSFASRVTIFYLIYAALWTCPSRPFAFDYSAKDARPVCRNLAQAHDQIVPIVKPYFHLAQQKAEPYTRPVIAAATPWVKRAHKVARPIYREADKRGRLIWKKRIEPARRRALKRARKQIDPYLKHAHLYHKKNIQPHIDTAHKVVKPYHDIYQRDVAPYVDQAYQYSLHSSSVSYAFYQDKVHPHVVQSLKHAYSFLVNHVDPAIRRFYSVYVRPQLDRLLAKVHERKAHWLGSDAIKAAQQEMKQTAKQADKHAQQAVKKAEQDAIKAQNDPSLLDRVKQAKDAAHDAATGKQTDPVKVAQLDAELDAEEEKVKDLLEVWEKGMTDLIEKEYKLAVDRLADLRNQRVADLPDRFGLVNEAFVEDTVSLILNRIERGLRKISARSDSDSKKAAAGKQLVDQQIAKFDQAALDTKVQISDFYEKLLQDERQVIETSSAEVRRYAAAAKKAYDDIMREAKFAATMDEWQGWDIGVRKRASLFAEELAAVQSNKKAVSASSDATDLRKDAPDVQKEVNSLRTWSDKLHSSARKELVAYSGSALAQLAGQGVAAKVSDITDRLAEQASRISTDAAAGMLGAVGLARSNLKLGEPAKEGYFARAKAYVASGSGSGSGSSFDDYINSLNAQVAAAGDSISSVAAQASSSVASAVGVSSSTPAVAKASAAVAGAVGGVAANVRSAAGAATDAAASAASSASSAASKASRSAASAVGASPTPETFSDYIDEAKQNAASAASWVSDAAQAGASSASSVASVASSSAGVAAGNLGEVAQSGASSASSLASVASSSASVAARSGASSASSAASVASRSASSAISDASKAARPSASSLSSAASSVASVASRSASSALSDAGKAAQSSASSASSFASSAASVASRSAASAAQSGASSASSLASKASRSVASAVSSVSASSLASSAASVVSSAAAESLASGSSVLSKASRSVASAVGASPTPETLEDYLEDAKEAVKSVAAKAHIEL